MKNFAIMAATALAVIGTMAGGMMTTEAEAKVTGISGHGAGNMSYETCGISGSSYDDYVYSYDYDDDDDFYYDDDYYYDYEDNDCVNYGSNYCYDNGDYYYEYYNGNLICR